MSGAPFNIKRLFFRPAHTDSVYPGFSPFAPLSAERIDAARQKHGEVVDQYLRYLHMGDPLADALVEHFETLPAGEGWKLLNRAIEEGIEALQDPPPQLTALFAELDHVPFWVDWERMRLGSAKICKNGVLVAVTFAGYALPYAYLAPANVPLVFTGELLDAAAHRYARTARFVIETFFPDGLRRDADGFKWAVMIRITHASARRRLLQSGTWDAARFGAPLNQAHNAMNTVFFSFYLLQGMRKLGVRFTPQEAESILLIWRYVGHLFGIDPELVYTSEEEAHRLVTVALSLEFDPDENTKKLCRTMLAAGASFMGINNPRLERWFIDLVIASSRHLLGDDLANRMGFPQAKHRLLCRAIILWIRCSEWLPFLMPPALRRYMGISFWLQAGEYETTPLRPN